MKRILTISVAVLLSSNVAFASNYLSKKNFNELVGADVPNYCVAKNKYYMMKIKNDFGNFVTKKYIASNVVLAAKNASEKIEFNKDLNRIYLIATILKNSQGIFSDFFKSSYDKDDEVFFLSSYLTSWLKNSRKYGYIPLTNLTLENLQTKKAKFSKTANTSQVANGLINYLSESDDAAELHKRILLLTAYLLTSTKTDITIYFDEDDLLSLSDEDGGHDFLIFFMRTFLENTKNPKIQNLIYLLATQNSNIVKYMLESEDTKQLFEQVLKFYKKAKKC